MRTIEDVKLRFRARLPRHADADKLAEGWLRAVQQQAIEANLSGGPLPTTLAGLRADLLFHVCLQMKRLVSERETEVMLRVPPTTARSLHRLLKSQYEDSLSEYVLAWALRAARIDGTGKFGAVKGDRIIFSDKGAMDAAIAEFSRGGYVSEWKRGDADKPYLLFVESEANVKRFGLAKWS